MFNNTTHFKIYLLFYSASQWDIILKNEKDTSTFSNSDLSMFNNIYLIKYDGCIYFSRELLSNVHGLFRQNLNGTGTRTRTGNNGFLDIMRTFHTATGAGPGLGTGT